MKSYFGTYTNSPVSEPVEATILVFDNNLNIGFANKDGSNPMVNWLLADVEATFDFSLQKSKVRNRLFPTTELMINGEGATSFIKEMQTEAQKPWHQKSTGKEWIRNSLLIAGILAVLFLGYLLIVPWLSQKLASNVSIKTERQLGDAVYRGMELNELEDTTRSILLNQFFAKMNVTTDYSIRLSVIENEVVNAFALPGGRIVVYSALLNEMESYSELAALLSHEFTHVNNKHSTRSIFRKLGSKIFLGLLFGKISAVTGIVLEHADNLKSLKYARHLEKEADMEGLAILTKRGIDPKGFTDLFLHLKDAGMSSMMPEFLGSHPDVDTRIAYIQESAKGAMVREDAELKAIFEKIK